MQAGTRDDAAGSVPLKPVAVSVAQVAAPGGALHGLYDMLTVVLCSLERLEKNIPEAGLADLARARAATMRCGALSHEMMEWLSDSG